MLKLEIIDQNGCGRVVQCRRVVVRADARDQPHDTRGTPVAIVVELDPGTLIASCAGAPDFEEVLQNLRVRDTLVVGQGQLLSDRISIGS